MIQFLVRYTGKMSNVTKNITLYSATGSNGMWTKVKTGEQPTARNGKVYQLHELPACKNNMDSLRLTCGFVLCRPVPLSVCGNCYLIENRTSLELARYNQCTYTFTYRHSFKVPDARRPVHFQVYKRLLTRWLHLQYNGNNFIIKYDENIHIQWQFQIIVDIFNSSYKNSVLPVM